VYPIKAVKVKPYGAQVRRGGKIANLGYFATAEEAALCVARSPAAAAAVAEAAARVPLTSEEARQQAQAERLVFSVGENPTGYFGVYHSKSGKSRPLTWQGCACVASTNVYLGIFATAKEAALSVARSVAAAKEAAAAPPLTGDDDVCYEVEEEVIVVLDAVEIDVE